jgi:hypothetical protein
MASQQRVVPYNILNQPALSKKPGHVQIEYTFPFPWRADCIQTSLFDILSRTVKMTVLDSSGNDLQQGWCLLDLTDRLLTLE